MKTVFVSVFQEEALVMKSILDAAGIENELLADRMMDVNPLFSIDVHGMQILVPDEREEEAKALVEDFKARKAKEKGA